MPTSSWRQICHVLEHVEDMAIQVAPRRLRVLDVGAGWGRYGALVHDSFNAYVIAADAKLQVTWTQAYAEFYECVLPDLPAVVDIDVVLLLDVIEHLEKSQAHNALINCRRLAPTIVSTPNGFTEQELDEWETHRSGWRAADFWGLGATQVQTVLGRERPPATMDDGQVVALFSKLGVR